MLTPIFFRESEIEKEKKESACNAGDLGLIPGPGRSLDEGNGYLPAWRILWTVYPWSHKELDMISNFKKRLFLRGGVQLSYSSFGNKIFSHGTQLEKTENILTSPQR